MFPHGASVPIDIHISVGCIIIGVRRNGGVSDQKRHLCAEGSLLLVPALPLT
jgi:hypothetical protein